MCVITEEMIKELRAKRDEAERHLDEAKSRLLQARHEMARQLCPHKVGDIVDCGGWSHKGKKMLVDFIGAPKCDWDCGEKWRVSGFVLKKDGTVGGIHYEFEG